MEELCALFISPSAVTHILLATAAFLTSSWIRAHSQGFISRLQHLSQVTMSPSSCNGSACRWSGTEDLRTWVAHSSMHALQRKVFFFSFLGHVRELYSRVPPSHESVCQFFSFSLCRACWCAIIVRAKCPERFTTFLRWNVELSLALKPSTAAVTHLLLKLSCSGLIKKVTDAPMMHCNNSVQQVAGIAEVVLLKVELVRATFTQSPCRNNQHSTKVIRHKCSCHQSRDGGEREEVGGSHSEQRSQQIVSGVESEAGLMQIWTCLLPGGNLNHPHVFFGGGKDPYLHQVARMLADTKADRVHWNLALSAVVAVWRGHSATILYSVWCRRNRSTNHQNSTNWTQQFSSVHDVKFFINKYNHSNVNTSCVTTTHNPWKCLKAE